MQLTRPHANLGEAGYLLCGFAGAAIFGAIAVSKNVDLLTLVRLLTVGFALGWVTASDLRERRIPNRVTIPAETPRMRPAPAVANPVYLMIRPALTVGETGAAP